MDRDHNAATRIEYRGTGFYVGLFAAIIVALVLFTLAVQNTQEVEVHFLGLEFSVPLFAVAIGAALLAVITDELIGLVWRRQRRLRLEERAELARLRAARTAEAGVPIDRTAAPDRMEEDATPPVSSDQDTDGEEETGGPGVF